MFPQFEYSHFGNKGPYYGNYGGLDYSAGAEDGTITGTSADPIPVDAYDLAFYRHDLVLQNASTPAERLDAHVDVVASVSGLLFKAAFDAWDPF